MHFIDLNFEMYFIELTLTQEKKKTKQKLPKEQFRMGHLNSKFGYLTHILICPWHKLLPGLGEILLPE